MIHREVIEKVIKALEDAEGYSFGNATEEEHETRREALATLRPYVENGGWQDISTAPKDGTEYAGIIKDAHGNFGQPFACFYDEDKGSHVCVRQTECFLHKPTHWMPLPQPPKEGE